MTLSLMIQLYYRVTPAAGSVKNARITSLFLTSIIVKIVAKVSGLTKIRPAAASYQLR